MQMHVFYFYAQHSTVKVRGEIESCSTGIDSTQPMLDFESKEDLDSLHLSLCPKQGLQVK